MANMRTVALARVSSKAQEDKGYSLDAQLKLMRNYCRDTRLQVVSEFKISETASKNDQRIVFRQMLTYVNKNNIAHLVVEKTDRLTRNFRDAVVIDDWLEADLRRRLHIVKEGLIIHKNAKSDTKLMWNIYLAIAKKYTDNLREEAMKGWDEKLAQGWMPAPPPPGYKTTTENYKKIHVIDEDTAPLVERAFRQYLEPCQTVSLVTDELASWGLATRKGRPFTKSAVHRMLRNPFYIGVILFNAREYPGAHEPLIDNDLFTAVQNKLGEKSQAKTVRHDPLFRGLVRCTRCRGAITWQLQKGRYYGSCQRRNEQCQQHPFIRHDNLESLAYDMLHQIDNQDTDRSIFSYVKQILETSRDPYVGQYRLGVMRQIKRQISRYEMMQGNLYEDKLAGVISEDMYAAKKNDLRDRLLLLTDRLRRIEVIEGKTIPKVAKKDTIVALYQSESKAGKRITLDALFTMNIEGGAALFKLRHKTPKLSISGMMNP